MEKMKENILSEYEKSIIAPLQKTTTATNAATTSTSATAIHNCTKYPNY